MCESSHDYFRTRKAFFFSLHGMFQINRQQSCCALVGFHVFTGCDIIERFLSKTFKSSSQEELCTLADLGDYETLPGASVLVSNI